MYSRYLYYNFNSVLFGNFCITIYLILFLWFVKSVVLVLALIQHNIFLHYIYYIKSRIINKRNVYSTLNGRVVRYNYIFNVTIFVHIDSECIALDKRCQYLSNAICVTWLIANQFIKTRYQIAKTISSYVHKINSAFQNSVNLKSFAHVKNLNVALILT